MNKLEVVVDGHRPTTRDGSHPDDELYVKQLAESIAEVLGTKFLFIGDVSVTLMDNRTLARRTVSVGFEPPQDDEG